MAKTKYTYKYNGQIVRNSDHIYKFGLVNHIGGVIACSATEKGALKAKNTEIARLERNIVYLEKKGKKDYLESAKQCLDDVKKWHTVELEVIEN